jgi:hypothetical protein
MGAQPSSAATTLPTPPSSDLTTANTVNDTDAHLFGNECTTPRDTLGGDYERVGTPEKTDVVLTAPVSTPTPTLTPVSLDVALLVTPTVNASSSLLLLQPPSIASLFVPPQPSDAPPPPSQPPIVMAALSSRTPVPVVPPLQTLLVAVPAPLCQTSLAMMSPHNVSSDVGTLTALPVPTTVSGVVAENPTIVTAVYGTGLRSRNVAPQLQQLDFPWRWQRHMNPNTFFGGDPHPGAAKTLSVTFAYPNTSQPNLVLKLGEYGGRWRQPQSTSPTILTFI